VFGRFNNFNNSVFATFFPSSFQVYKNLDYTRNDVAGLDFNTGNFTHSIRFSYLKFQNRILDAVQGSTLPFANYPVAINIGTFTVGPNLLAPQATVQSDHQLKYDGSKTWGRHILRYGFGWNHIQGGGFASFFNIVPQGAEFGPGPDGSNACFAGVAQPVPTLTAGNITVDSVEGLDPLRTRVIALTRLGKRLRLWRLSRRRTRQTIRLA
jgi:hypothetical protein